jgi:hypothetical protein
MQNSFLLSSAPAASFVTFWLMKVSRMIAVLPVCGRR